MIMLSHGWKCYPLDEYIFDFFSHRIIGVIVHGHVINKYIYYGSGLASVQDDISEKEEIIFFARYILKWDLNQLF